VDQDGARTESVAAEATDALRQWVYGQIPRLFADIPSSLPRLDGAEPCGGTHPRSREAIGRLGEDLAASAPELLGTEQVRLFVNAPGGVAAPPYASWYLDGCLLGPASRWAAEEYRGQALEAAPEGEPPDFIATEMEYMFFLCRHAQAARLTGDRNGLEQVRRAQVRFFQAHLGRWLPLFARDLRAASPPAPFERVADLIEAFCDEEGRYLSHLRP
jgi:TorA maturation chaperone TorD